MAAAAAGWGVAGEAAAGAGAEAVVGSVGAAATSAAVGRAEAGEAMMQRAIRRLRNVVRSIRSPRKPHRLFTRHERHRIVAAIQRAEDETSGEIRVHVEAHCPGDATTRAREVFATLGMHRTERRNASLIYVATADRKFAVVADQGIDAVVPAGFWEEIRDTMAADFRRGRFCEGVCRGIGAIAEHLHAHFPAQPGPRNELSDGISEGMTNDQ